MTQSKSTKRALIASAASVLISCAMLVGTTFAWFTDSVSSGKNVIQAGNLDVTMEWRDGKEDPTASDGWTDASGSAIFDYDKWEPGYAQVRHIRISNVGNLALKYQINIASTGEVGKLAEAIDVYYVQGGQQIANRSDLNGLTPIGTLKEILAKPYAAKGHLLAEAGSNVDVATIALKMREDAGNEYQNLSIGSEFTIQLVATQYAHESDSFDNQYDANAEYPVQNLTEFKDAIQSAKPGETIALTADIAVNENLSIPKGVVLDGLGNTLITQARVYVPQGATLRNINFEKPVSPDRPNGSNPKNASFIYASSLENELIIENCTFVDTQWDAIQVTPKAGANVVIRNNVFQTTENVDSVNNGKCERYIHVQATNENIGAKFTVTITGNKFENIDKCRNSVIDVDNLANKSDITVGKNTFSGKEITAQTLDSVIWIVTGSNLSANEATMDDYNVFVGENITALR